MFDSHIMKSLKRLHIFDLANKIRSKPAKPKKYAQYF